MAKDYRIVYSLNPNEVTRIVLELISLGWLPLGGISVGVSGTGIHTFARLLIVNLKSNYHFLIW